MAEQGLRKGREMTHSHQECLAKVMKNSIEYSFRQTYQICIVTKNFSVLARWDGGSGIQGATTFACFFFAFLFSGHALVWASASVHSQHSFTRFLSGRTRYGTKVGTRTSNRRTFVRYVILYAFFADDAIAICRVILRALFFKRFARFAAIFFATVSASWFGHALFFRQALQLKGKPLRYSRMSIGRTIGIIYSASHQYGRWVIRMLFCKISDHSFSWLFHVSMKPIAIVHTGWGLSLATKLYDGIAQSFFEFSHSNFLCSPWWPFWTSGLTSFSRFWAWKPVADSEHHHHPPQKWKNGRVWWMMVENSP